MTNNSKDWEGELLKPTIVIAIPLGFVPHPQPTLTHL
jgi:hypothetical protein